MEASSLGALKNYASARQALTPDSKQASGPDLGGAKPSSATDNLADAAKQFADVFEHAETSAEAMTTGNADAHSVVEALARAEVALETAVTIRNRVVEAYQELLRMPV
ncbi:flagellar hook-basal body complex protein FliE [Aquisalinus flavus]|uniref:Flagellar hook-basal body complex protein FliE n=1 Tax=Aquisalinus flavus TaxID=1526572 RepID=A0A8J2Y825_9PROT|nr:flagellar hook-basal body complex protein FliE [Aquisalinus flavus]MBD0425922.1 flagellar hook-basal body complex protein FliE [Aquisalinus flavus]UNE48484.1 flagellar hook-basal body protein FliE [Aquisalinus flavus]GGD12200.1 flagellar hook-basal body protein FliE [Aquisalinus flavus]